jgi:hypothetical protein
MTSDLVFEIEISEAAEKCGYLVRKYGQVAE